MKKAIALTLALLLCLSLFTACGGKEQDIGGTVTGTPSEEAAPKLPEDYEEPEEPSVPETSDEPAEPEPEEPAEEEYSMGITIGGTYTNDFAGLSCTLDENWMFFDEAQLAELNGLTLEMFDDEAIRQAMEDSGAVYDMYAARLDGMGSINIIFENLGLLYGSVLSEADYAQLATQNLEPSLASAGFSDLSCEIVTVDFCGSEHTAIRIEGILQEIPIYEILVLQKVGNYMMNITFASYVEDLTADMLSSFSAA